MSTLDEMPPGRAPVTTRLVWAESEAKMWAFVRQHLDRGRQAYVVCPLIEESDLADGFSAADLRMPGSGGLAGYRLRLLHGRLRPAEKAEAMAAYAAGEVDVLVSTTVIEVGVDVPNATVMVIMGARRFGLVPAAPAYEGGWAGGGRLSLLPHGRHQTTRARWNGWRYSHARTMDSPWRRRIWRREVKDSCSGSDSRGWGTCRSLR